MKVTIGIAVGITASILAQQLWRPFLGWALSRGDT